MFKRQWETISPKDPERAQDPFPGGFRRNGRRNKKKLFDFCFLFETSNFLESQDVLRISSRLEFRISIVSAVLRKMKR